MTASVTKHTPSNTLAQLVVYAIGAGVKVEHSKSATDNAFHAGEVAAYVHAAAKLAEDTYGVSREALHHRLLKEVEDAHMTWGDADLRDEEWVAEQAGNIVLRVLIAL